MSNFFLRKVRLVVGDIDQGGLEITDLRIAFNIQLVLAGYASSGTIKIYNLSKSNRNKIQEEFTELFLYAGYEDNISLIFSGNIVTVTHEKNGPDWITEITAGDAIKAINGSTINKSLPAGQNTESIFNELISQMDGVSKGVTEGLRDCISNKRSLLRGLVLSGNVRDWLDKLSKTCGFDYSVNNGVIETTNIGQPLTDVPPVQVSDVKGLVDSPQKTEMGMKIKSLLLPQLKLARVIEVQSTVSEGNYRMDKINHVGDTHTNDWFSIIEGGNF
jgi:hypothetical protein